METVNTIELKDGTKIRVSYEHGVLNDNNSPLDWDTDYSRFYSNESENYTFKMFDIENFEEDFKGKRGWYGVNCHVTCDSCPGLWIDGNIKKRVDINIKEIIDNLPESQFSSGPHGILMIKAKDISEAVYRANNIKDMMDTWLSGATVYLEHYRDTTCGSCGHIKEEIIDEVGDYYINPNCEKEILDELGIGHKLLLTKEAV